MTIPCTVVTSCAAVVPPCSGNWWPRCAAASACAVPEVDRVGVRVVIDSYQIAVAPSTKAGSVDIERFGWGLSDQPPTKTLVSEFGLSLHVESQRGGEVRHLLVDYGFTP